MSSKDLDDGDGASSRGGASSGGGSQTSSQRSDAKYLKLRDRASAEREEGDLLEQKRSIQDGIFQCMYTLVRQSALGNWKFAMIKVLLEGLMGFIVTFNPSVSSWRINKNNPVWQVVRWTVWRSPVMRLYGYDTYILIMYIMAGAVMLSVLGLVWLTLAMRRQEQSKWLKNAATFLHICYDVIFIMLYVSFFDYFVFTANCNFASPVKDHVYFEGVLCLEMPHILHMAVALVTALIFFCVTALMVVASSDLNPVSRGYLASPAAITRLKILTAKAVYIIVADDMQSWPKPQSVIVVGAVLVICWWNFRRLPFYRTGVNVVWSSMWCGILYTAMLLAVVAFGKDHTEEHMRNMTLYVLYGIFPVIAGGMVISYAHAWWVGRPAKKFKDLEPGVKVTKIHKFEDYNEVEVLSRVMRVFDIDYTVDDEAAANGEAIIKAGMQMFPNTCFLLILYANFLLEVRKDGPAARTQLQLASKHSPSLVERYQIFCTGEASKRLKDSQDGGMDLQAYIEFRRNFRAVLRVHKEVMLLQADLWTIMIKSSVRVTEVDTALEALEAGTGRAHQVYKRVLERYPTNGKLLRTYGKFLEDVKHDPIAATRAYSEASRNGGGDAIMNLDLSAVQSASKPEFLTSMSMEDDAVIVINAEGVVMMVSQAVQKVFGYNKAELEGTNVAMLMPQPFSQRHPSYLQRYTAGGEPHILDTVREVVALHKERYVFPMSLCVTKMSGTGTDSVFLGVCRPMTSNMLNVRAWVAPNGVFLCGDQQFASMCGVTEGELVGRTLVSLMDTSDLEVEQLLDRCRDASPADLQSGTIKAQVMLKHRYLDPVPMDVTVGMAGTDGQRIFVLNCVRTDGEEGNIMVVDQHMRLRFSSCGVSTLLGYPMRKLGAMRLDQLLPPPFNTLHTKWLKDAPSVVPTTSCRSGKVVQLLNENGSNVPVRIKVRTVTTDDGSSTQHVVQVDKVPADELFDEKRLVITADFNGRVLSVLRPESQLFDFTSGDLVGSSLCDIVDIFSEWRERNGESQLQLFMLALLDKEQEMPGTSWRVRVHAPPSDGVPHLPAIAGATPAAGGMKGPPSKSACLQVEMFEEDNDEHAVEKLDTSGTIVKVTLWRRDLLTGVVELDEGLIIRKASVMTGLIVGMPASAMAKKPIQRFLDMPHDTTWSNVVDSYSKGHNKKRSALKGTTNRGVISPPMAFIGPHPDTGTMRIITQGVEVLAPGGRPKVTLTLHPDTTFAGAHANLMRVLHLDGSRDPTAAAHGVEAHAGHVGGESHGTDRGLDLIRQPADAIAGETGDERDAHSDGGQSDSEHSKGPKDGSDGGPDLEAEGQAKLHRKAASKSDFVAQWVRTLTNKVSGALDVQQQQQPDRRSSSPGLTGMPAATSPDSPTGAADEFKAGGGLAAIPEDGKQLLDRAAQITAKSFGRVGGNNESLAAASRQTSRVDSPPMGEPRASGHRASGEKGPDKDKGEDWEKASEGGESSQSGSQAASGITGVTDATSASELMIDTRRGRLLKALTKLLCGPSLMVPLDRLRLHTYAILALMLTTHIVCYVVVNQEISKEHHDINLVARQALAMDRSQLIAVRAMMGAFCARDNVTEKVSVCANTLNFTMGKLKENIELMEKHHQYVYLGESKVTTIKLMPEVYDVWTSDKTDYISFMDTSPPRVHNERAAVWVLGSRFIAAARESLYWLPAIRENYRLHRTFNFLVTNGLGPLFEAYARSLDLLVDAAWESVDELKTSLIAMMVVEALFIQVCCLAYEWLLVQRLERTRLVAMLAMLGLPGPVLRQLASRDAKILEDSDDEDEGDESDAEEEQREGDKGAKGEGGGDKAAAVAKGVRHADSGHGGSADGEGARPAGTGAITKALTIKKTREGAAGGEEKATEDGEGKAMVLAGEGAAPARQASNVGDTDTDDSSDGGHGGGAAAAKSHGAQLLARGGGPAASGAASGGAKLRQARVDGYQINGKRLVPSLLNLSKFMAPFVLWNLAVVIVYAVSIVQLNGMQGPLASLNMASHIIYRYTRVRAIAFGFVSQDDKESRDLWRGMLSREMGYFESEYDALMYGGTPITQVNAVFNHPVPASTFASSSFANEFFRVKRCFRYEQDACFEEGHIYYEVTHNGLDVMVRRMLSEMKLLAEDADEDVTYNGTRYMFMAGVGGNDLYEGLQQGAQLFVDYSIGRYNQVANVHTILLIFTIFGVVAYVVFILWPHLARLKADASRQSALLSHVPPELDVRAHVRAVFKRSVAKRTRGKAGSLFTMGAGAAEGAASGATSTVTTTVA